MPTPSLRYSRVTSCRATCTLLLCLDLSSLQLALDILELGISAPLNGRPLLTAFGHGRIACRSPDLTRLALAGQAPSATHRILGLVSRVLGLIRRLLDTVLELVGDALGGAELLLGLPRRLGLEVGVGLGWESARELVRAGVGLGLGLPLVGTDW